jgi:pyruvate/2-oxoacid:ferredoxin oxidoreductase beta subunit
MEAMKYLSLGFLLMLSIGTYAQQGPGRASVNASRTATTQDRITQIKIAKLTADMKLTKVQAQKFWPIYDAFDLQRREIRREIRSLSRNFSEDDDAYKKQERIQDLKQKELDLTKRYKADFLKVISEQQYGIMLVSEERFNQTLLETLKERNKD